MPERSLRMRPPRRTDPYYVRKATLRKASAY
jgi:hypothetical protein